MKNNLVFKILTGIISFLMALSILELGVFMRILYIDHYKVLKNMGFSFPLLTHFWFPVASNMNIILIVYSIIYFCILFIFLKKSNLKSFILFLLLLFSFMIFIYVNLLCGTFAAQRLIDT